jgi:nitrogen fixation/metabolism regulation signal transduction histidine kinase
MEWSEDIVEFLQLIRSKCVDLSAKHTANFFYYKSCENYFQIPTIVLSVFSSFISVGVSNFVEQPTISTTTASISMAIAILGSIRLYLNLTLNVALELDLSKEFHILALDISKELFLPIELRKQTQQEFLEAIYGAYIGLLQKSSLIKAEHEIAVQKNKLSPR